MTRLDATRVNLTIFHDHSVHWYYITLIEEGGYSKHDVSWSTTVVIITDVSLHDHFAH